MGDSVMATYVLGMQGGIVHQHHIEFNKPQLFFRDEVNLFTRGNDIFLNNLAEGLRVLIQ